MRVSPAIKQLAKAIGLYPQLRAAHRAINRDARAAFLADCAFYRPFIQPGDLVFDIGANYGMKTEAFVALGARVVAVEPQPDCLAELAARNPQATKICAAVGRAPGEARLYVDPHRTGSSLVPGWQGEKDTTITVQVTTLDSLIAQYGVPAFCKIDVEGFERDVFAGLSHQLPALSFEFHRDRLGEARACLSDLRRFGPAIGNITGEETSAFALTAWIDLDAMDRWLAHDVPATGYAWGDVFVRT
jgi:FkbM family methyltransferase